MSEIIFDLCLHCTFQLLSIFFLLLLWLLDVFLTTVSSGMSTNSQYFFINSINSIYIKLIIILVYIRNRIIIATSTQLLQVLHSIDRYSHTYIYLYPTYIHTCIYICIYRTYLWVIIVFNYYHYWQTFDAPLVFFHSIHIHNAVLFFFFLNNTIFIHLRHCWTIHTR